MAWWLKINFNYTSALRTPKFGTKALVPLVLDDEAAEYADLVIALVGDLVLEVSPCSFMTSCLISVFSKI